MSDDLESKAEHNLDIQNNPDKQNPALPVEAQMKKAGDSTPPIKDQYQDSPPDATPLTSTHDRDSVQPPDPARAAFRGAPPMPLKEQK